MGLLLRMMKSYFATGKCVILDSGFYVFKGLIQLIKKGVFSCSFTKNRRYCPSMVPGKEMGDLFGGVEVGEKYSIQVTVDYVIYNLWGMTEPNYVMRMMDTGGRLLTYDTFK